MNHNILLTRLLLASVFIAGCSSNSPDSGSTERAQQPQTTAPPQAVSVLPAPPGRPGERAEERMLEAVVVTGARISADAVAKQSGAAGYPVTELAPYYPREQIDRDRYDHFTENGFVVASESPVSTFSIDVDTASYANVRRYLNSGQLPPRDAVRVEEMINYFSYDYPRPTASSVPFSVSTEVGPSPWHAGRHLLRIGIRGYQKSAEELPAANLVFLVDTSGSMQSRDKLALVKASLKMLTRQLDGDDRISLVVYAGSAGVVLEPTEGDDTAGILAAIEQLEAGGSTNGGAGIQLAYRMAEKGYIEGGVNRVILATDGDFNVGVTDQQALKEMVEERRDGGISLTVLGFGRGNYNDALMQEIAQIGDGNAAYIDTLHEARKVLVDQMASTFETIARDVKIQIEFNPATVAEYRLVGYESRHLEREDFNNDKVDAGDIGAGHRVTALYEVTLATSGVRSIDPLRYGNGSSRRDEAVATDELAYVKLRYKMPGKDSSQLLTTVVSADQLIRDLDETSNDYRFASAVAGFGQLLRGGKHTDSLGYEEVVALAEDAKGTDNHGYRSEFINLVKTSAALSGHRVSQR